MASALVSEIESGESIPGKVRPTRFRHHFALWVAVFVAYCPVLFDGQPIWDDHAFFSNPLLSSTQGLWAIWFQPRTNTLEEHYWPLTYTFAFFIRRWGGATAFPFHLSNVVLHALNASLVFGVLRRWTRRYAFWGAVFFALHPIQAESVAWIVELKNLLSFCLAAAAFLLYVCWERRAPASVLSGGCAILFFAALLSKSSVVPFPVVIFLALWAGQGMTRQRFFFAGTCFALSLTYALFDVWFTSRSGKLVPTHDWLERLAIAGQAILHYLRTMIWPVGLCAIYPKWPLEPQKVSSGIAAVMLVGTGMLALAVHALKNKRSRRLLLWLGGTLAMLSPTLGLIPFSYQRQAFVADRFAYHASAVFLPGLVVFAAALLRSAATSHRALQAGLVAVAGILAALTFQRAMAFRKIESLSRDTIRKNPRAWTARYYLADALARQGNFEGAAKEYAQVFWGSVEDTPSAELERLEMDILRSAAADPRAAFNRGLLAARKREFAEAMRSFEMATSSPQLRPQAVLAIAAIELQTGATTQALERIKSLYGVSPPP